MPSTLENRLFTSHLEDDEVVSKIVHKHWIVGLNVLVWPAGLVLFCLAGLLVQPGRIMTYVLLLGLASCLVWLVRNFLDYYMDAWVITDKGIIDLAWLGWFHRQSTRILYSDIQGVSYEIQGVWATLLRYGTISVEKISTGGIVSLPYVKKPKQIEILVLQNMEAYLHSKNMKNADHVQEVLAHMVSEHFQLGNVREKVPPKPSKE